MLFRNGNEVERVIGADSNQIVQKVQKVLESSNSVEKRLISLINQEPVMVFIKGTPAEPRCGFTRTLIGLLNQLNAKYGSFDILSDDEVRQSLKVYSKWPTYPQLYIKGSLVGGLDIIQVMHKFHGNFLIIRKLIIIIFTGFARKWRAWRFVEGLINEWSSMFSFFSIIQTYKSLDILFNWLIGFFICHFIDFVIGQSELIIKFV